MQGRVWPIGQEQTASSDTYLTSQDNKSMALMLFSMNNTMRRSIAHMSVKRPVATTFDNVS